MYEYLRRGKAHSIDEPHNSQVRFAVFCWARALAIIRSQARSREQRSQPRRPLARPLTDGTLDAYIVVMADILGSLEQAVLLAVVHLRDDAYGRAVLREASKRLGRELSAGAIYATLDRLEAQSLLTSRLYEASARAGRARRYYTISAKGVSAVNE